MDSFFPQVYQQFMKVAVATVKQFYGEDPRKSECYARMISELHAERIKVSSSISLYPHSQECFG